MSILSILLALIIGYLLGSISFAVLIARWKGVNILQVGSKNPGATNVKRVLGSGLGNTVFFLDALKGSIASGWPFFYFGFGQESSLALGVLGLIAAIMGHSFSCFLNFSGGKGVATTMGGLAALMPGVLLIGLMTWLLVYYSSRVVAIGSIAFALSLPFGAFIIHGVFDLRFGLGLLLALLIIIRHRSNIQRLMQGKENSFKK
ncbi:MAG: putative glycerol-3-phosphate acyltransferase [Opitutia bacterium UBA7350]|nr:MAG: putative glycerol-3-phosphate acyltransferase [Opitutae bacterium UBA7350]